MTPVLEDVSGRALCRDQIVRIQARIARGEGRLPLEDLCLCEGTLSAAVRLLSQFLGAPELQISEAMVLRSRTWHRLVDRIAPVLARYPEVKATLDALVKGATAP